MRYPKLFLLFAALTASTVSSNAQDPKSAIQQKLKADYTLTQATADNTDIVTAGSILVLKKSDLMMAPVTSTDLYQNTYKDGKITQGFAGRFNKGLKGLSTIPGMSGKGAATRTFVTGEKLWVTGISVKDDGVYFNLFTDAYSDIRYKASLKFQFAKGTMLAPEQAETLVAEVFGIQPADDVKTSTEKPASAPAPAQPGQPAAAPKGTQVAEAVPAPIAPPPPPVDQPPAPPKSIGIGQTRDQVVADWGQPQKVLKLKTKEVYVYPDMKVTFVNSKVTDIQ